VTPVFEVKPERTESRDELASGQPDVNSGSLAPPSADHHSLSWRRQRPDSEVESLFATTGEMPALAVTLELPSYPFRQDGPGITHEYGARRSGYSTAYALILNTAGTTGLGFVYWAVATHIYSAKTVGRSSALVSALLLLSALTQLNVSSALQRYLPQAGNSARRLVGYGYAVSSLVALPVAVGFVLVMPRLSSQWEFLSGSRLLTLLFVGAALVWGVFALEDAALTGLRRAGVVPIENTVYGVLKLTMLIFVAALLPAAGIFASWVAPLVVVIPVVNFLIFRKFMRNGEAEQRQKPVRRREIVRFTSADYLASLCNQAYASLLPLMVLSALGAAASGRFYIAWTIAAGPTMIAANFGTSLMVDAAAAPHRLAELTRGIAIRCTVTTLACSAVVILGAEPILRIYGAKYATQAAPLLMLLGLGAIPRALIMLTWSLDRLARRMRRAALTQALLTILVLAGSRILLGRYGIDAIGYAWLSANVVVALLRLPTLISAAGVGRRKPGRHRAPSRVAR